MEVLYTINSIYVDDNFDNRKELFNHILSRVIYLLEKLEDDNK